MKEIKLRLVLWLNEGGNKQKKATEVSSDYLSRCSVGASFTAFALISPDKLEVSLAFEPFESCAAFGPVAPRQPGAIGSIQPIAPL